SMVTLRLLALKTRKNIASSPGTSGRLRRDCSPPGGSILMTSAPSQPRNCVQVVPASNCVRSRIRMPVSARSAMAWPPWAGRASGLMAARGGGLRALEASALVRRPRQRPRLQRPRAPAAILLARAHEGLARGVEAAGPQRDGAERVASQRALTRVAAAGMRLEHACGTLLRARRRPGRRALDDLDE